ncbi:MAG: hypothetical protein ACJ74G_10590 [Blastocatellia bacterium]
MFRKANLFSAMPNMLPALVVIALFALVNGQSVTTSINRIASQTPQTETRKIVIHRSKQMPESSAVAITAIRNLQGDQWLRELEIEVQNNFSKPIYHLEIDLRFPEVAIQADNGATGALVIPLVFGRSKLMSPGERATATDRPIHPGERYVFRVPEANWKAIELYLAEHRLPFSAITKIWLRIYELSFGDGTGLEMDQPFFNKQATGEFKEQVKTSLPKRAMVSKRSRTKELKYALWTRASPVTPNAIPLQLSYGAQFSGCWQYDKDHERCPYLDSGPCALRIYRLATASTENPICLGFIKYDSNLCYVDGAYVRCS